MKKFRLIFFFTLIIISRLNSFDCIAKSKSKTNDQENRKQTDENKNNDNNENKSKKEKKSMIIHDGNDNDINSIINNDANSVNNNSDSNNNNQDSNDSNNNIIDVVGKSIIEDDGKELVGEEYTTWARIKANMTPKQFKILVQECRYIRKMLLKVINYNKLHPAHEQLKDLLDSETQPIYYKIAFGVNNKNKRLSKIIRLNLTENILTLGPFNDSATANNLIKIFNSIGVNSCSLLPVQNKNT